MDEMLGPMQDVLARNFQMDELESVALIAELPLASRQFLRDKFVSVDFEPGADIVKQGETQSTFFVIKSGSVTVNTQLQSNSVREQVHIATLGDGDHFGERAVLTGEPRAASVRACTRVQCLSLAKEHFDAVLKPLGSLQQELGRRDRELAALQKAHIRFNELDLRTVLGVGSFGYVRLAVHKPTQKVLALKAMRKAHVMKKQQEQHVVNERRVTSVLDHPFLLHLYSTYQDDEHIYMLTEALMGGELFSLLLDCERFDGPTSRFYMAQVVSGFACLHQLGVVYRDLKPENLILDEQGYLRIVDFGFAKLVADQKTFTLCGTPEYLSPEVVMNKGHGLSTDWWSAGVLLFEMLEGTSPFAADSVMDTYKRIVRCDYEMPAAVKKERSGELITQLLTADHTQRLGSQSRGAQDIFDHGLFSNLDWDALLAKDLKPPWVPKLQNELDTSHFEEYGEEDKPWRNMDLSSIDVSTAFATFSEF